MKRLILKRSVSVMSNRVHNFCRCGNVAKYFRETTIENQRHIETPEAVKRAVCEIHAREFAHRFKVAMPV